MILYSRYFSNYGRMAPTLFIERLGLWLLKIPQLTEIGLHIHVVDDTDEPARRVIEIFKSR